MATGGYDPYTVTYPCARHFVSALNLAIGAAAVGVHGKEGDIFRRVFIWSLLFLAFVCALSGLQASVLSWMVP